MNSILFALSLAGAVSAQIVNGYNGAPPPGYQAPASSSSAAPSMMTPAPSADSGNNGGYLQDMPYSSFKDGGYKSLSCGYGYSKDSSGYCKPDSWWQDQGCYETIIINKCVLLLEIRVTNI
jgi:hypothetical protein